MRETEIESLCNRADEIDPIWYSDWCERDGSVEELIEFLAKQGINR